MSETTLTEKMVQVYIKIRDQRAVLKAQFEENDKILRDQLDALESELLEVCKKAGADSIRTKNGTIIRSVKTQYWTSDWENMHKFILENQAPELLERRISQSTMKEFLANNPDKIPPGLNADSRYTVTIRRASNI
jgi:predicted metal-dependent phosphotriesterase family hydrolase